ncbi:MAG: hypothetical protein M3Q50_08755 [Chloroflexota bacterium]|nr:hypothetical protein [Chloroflexota bacterium]
MQFRHLRGAARLFLVMVLIAGTVISGYLPVSDPSRSPSEAAALVAKNKHARNQGTQSTTQRQQSNAKKNGQNTKEPGKSNNPNKGKNKNAGKNNGKSKQRRGKASGSLDAGQIAAANAETVAALQCDGDLTAIRVDGRVYCTHGEDPERYRARTGTGGEVRGAGAGETGSRALCIDDGASGVRVQLVYVYRNGQPNRLAELQSTFRRLATEMDAIFDQSARKTGDSLRVRFVTSAGSGCQVDIQQLQATSAEVSGFDSLVGKMQSAGFNRIDRKYLMMVDDSVFCGVGTFSGGAGADSPTTRAHDFTGYARVDLPCWDAGTMAHELSHNLGAVQYSAPNTSGGAHCIDEWDVMCYSDTPYRPAMRIDCDPGLQDFRLDCGSDDYFAMQPKSSYLASHWNMARSIYLTPGNGPACADARFEPDDAYWYDYWEVPLRAFPIGLTEKHAFCAESGDTDWTLIRAIGGTSYTIETKNLAPDVDTDLVLYRGFEEMGWDGMEEFGANNNRSDTDLSSLITFIAPNDGSFLVGIANVGGGAGFDKTYSLSITEADVPAFGDMSLKPAEAQPGVMFTATVGGRSPGETVDFRWERGGKSDPLGAAVAGADGIALGSLAVPGDAIAGENQVDAFAGNRLVGTATMTVDVPTVTTPPAPAAPPKSKKGKKGKGGKKKGGGKGKP